MSVWATVTSALFHGSILNALTPIYFTFLRDFITLRVRCFHIQQLWKKRLRSRYHGDAETLSTLELEYFQKGLEWFILFIAAMLLQM